MTRPLLYFSQTRAENPYKETLRFNNVYVIIRA